MSITAADVRDQDADPRREDQHRADALEIERAKATTAPEVRCDGGEPERSADMDTPLDVGDHVRDVNDPDATMVVIRSCEDLAGEYYIDDLDESVAEYNGVSDSERVYQVVYASRTDRDLADCRRYPFPRSRLEAVARVHDRDDDQEVSE